MDVKKGNYKLGYCKTSGRHPLYRIWSEMRQRCYNKNNKRYDDWGGRGIKVCNDWLYASGSFINWALSHGWKKGLLIDRIDNNGHYTPNNCRFTTPKISSNNRRLRIGISGIQGIGWDGERNCWTIRTRENGKQKRFGRYKLLSDAIIKQEQLLNVAIFTDHVVSDSPKT